MAKESISNAEALKENTAALKAHTRALKQHTAALVAHTAALPPTTATQFVYSIIPAPRHCLRRPRWPNSAGTPATWAALRLESTLSIGTECMSIPP